MRRPYARMTQMMTASPLLGDSSAVTALEYGIMAAFFCLTLLGIFTRFGASLTAMFSGVATSL